MKFTAKCANCFHKHISDVPDGPHWDRDDKVFTWSGVAGDAVCVHCKKTANINYRLFPDGVLPVEEGQ